MRLTELEAELIALTDDGHRQVDTVEEAQGVFFLCPKCFAANSGNVGTHGCICWFYGRGVPDSQDPKPGRWAAEGNNLDDLTLSATPEKSRSILLTSGCGWHGYITNGETSDA